MTETRKDAPTAVGRTPSGVPLPARWGQFGYWSAGQPHRVPIDSGQEASS